MKFFPIAKHLTSLSYPTLSLDTVSTSLYIVEYRIQIFFHSNFNLIKIKDDILLAYQE